MDRDTYCIKVCGGKCCTFYPEGIRCPRQAADGSCGIYEGRYAPGAPDLVVIGFHKNKPLWCGRIEQIIAKGQLPKEIEKYCCYAHPELLEMFDGRQDGLHAA